MFIEKIREILCKHFRNKAHLIRILPDNENFVRMDLFDSFELIMVISLIEKEFKIKIEAADLAGDKLNSLDKVESFLMSRRGLS